jgi:hypothetical protein
MKRITDFIKTLNRSKVVHGVGAFLAIAIPTLLMIKAEMPAESTITVFVSSVVGVLSRAQFIWQKVVPLLDGSSVIQVKPPTAGITTPSLVMVASDPSKVAVPKQSDDAVTGNIRPPTEPSK